MISKACIVPTGDEIRNGTVIDTDSPMLMQNLLRLDGTMDILRTAPVADEQGLISRTLEECIGNGCDLVVVIGGSGSGHMHSEILGRDYTYQSMAAVADRIHSTALYGKNGHLWSRLVCAEKGNTMMINVPGPYVEAEAAIRAFCMTYMDESEDPEILNRRMAEAVVRQYGDRFGHMECAG